MSQLVDLIRAEAKRIAAQARGALRGVLAAVSRATQVQLVDGEGLAGESLKGVELFQHFGFSSAPPEGSQIIVLPLGGRTSAAVIVASEHGNYRFHLGADGEAALYNQWGDVVHMRADRTIHLVAAAKVLIDTPDVTINASSSVTINSPSMTFNGANLTANASAQVLFATPVVVASAAVAAVTSIAAGTQITAGTNIVANGDVADQGGTKTMSAMRGVFNSHTHPENNTPTNVTSATTTLM